MRPEIEECLLAHFCAVAQSLDQTIRMVGFAVRPIGRFGAPKKHCGTPLDDFAHKLEDLGDGFKAIA